MKFLNEQKLSLGQYRIIDNNNNKYKLSIEKDCCPTDPRSREEIYFYNIFFEKRLFFEVPVGA